MRENKCHLKLYLITLRFKNKNKPRNSILSYLNIPWPLLSINPEQVIDCLYSLYSLFLDCTVNLQFTFIPSVLLACVYVWSLHPHLMLTESRKVVRSPGTKVTHGCEPPHGCWDWNPVLASTAATALDCRVILM